jgi:DUF4097 and DUF4098 domain-containing protein YvlB
MKCFTLIAALVFAGAAQAAAPDISNVNAPITVDAKQRVGNLASVNGSIHIGDQASAGVVHTVNGGITLDEGATALSLKVVNGAIHAQRNVAISGPVTSVNGTITLEPAGIAGAVSTVNGAVHLNAAHVRSVTTVNGSVTLEPEAEVADRIATVNGRVRLNAAHVGGGIETVEHDIDIGPNSRVEGGLLVRKRDRGWFEKLLHEWFPEREPPPRIVIGPGAVVTGTLRFQCEVKLYVSDRARIGAVEGATAIAYAGEQPLA